VTKADVEKLLTLTEDERVELGWFLLSTVEPEPGATLPIPSWQKTALQEALEDFERNPDAGIPWEQVRAELWPGL